MTRPQSTLKNAALTMVGQLLARLLALLFYAVFARLLGPERYGDQGFGAAVGTLCVVLLEPGLNPLLVRDGARDRAVLETHLAQTLGFKLMMLALVWPLSVIICMLAGYGGAVLTAVIFAGGTILLGALEELAAAALTALERLDLEAGLRFLSKIIGMGPALLVMALGGGFESVLATLTAGAVVTAALGLVLVARAGVRVRVMVDIRVMAARIATAWPLAVSGILWLLTLRLDQVLASAMGVPHGALGNYNAAVKVVEALVLFPGAVATAFQPVLARTWMEGAEVCSRHLKNALFAALSLAIPVTVGGALLAEGLTRFIYGDRFEGTPQLLAIQLLGLPLIGLQFIATHALVASGAVRSQAVAVAANLVVNVGCNVALVPALGVAGASWSAVVSGVAACAVYLVLLRRQGLRPGLVAAAWRPLVAAGVMASALVSVGPRWPLGAAIAAGGLVYAAVFLLLGGAGAMKALKDARSSGGQAAH